MDNRPIGVFDSGLGGLTVVKKMREILPGENIVYFGDTQRVPYGGRSKQTLLRYVAQDIRFLQSFDVKMVVAACGTASAVALPEIAQNYDVSVLGVLEQAAKSAIEASVHKKIGVIATSATIKSDAYSKVIRQICPEAQVYSKACPLFVPLVENGHLDTQVAHLVAQEYLREILDWGADTLIMGCTHYPLLRNTIADILGDSVSLVDVGEAMAMHVRKLLNEANLCSGQTEGGACRYYVSDEVDNFEALGGLFLQSKIEGMVNKVDIDKY